MQSRINNIILLKTTFQLFSFFDFLHIYFNNIQIKNDRNPKIKGKAVFKTPLKIVNVS